MHIKSYLKSIGNIPIVLTGFFEGQAKCEQALKLMNDYLEEGVYWVSENIAFKSTFETKRFLKDNFTMKERGIGLLGHLWSVFIRRLRKKVRVISGDRGSDFNKGTLLLVSNGGNLRVFDLHNEMVITKYKDKATYEACISGDKFLRKLLNAPFAQAHINDLVLGEHLYLESIIKGKTLWGWEREVEESVIKEVFGQYKKYFNEIVPHNYLTMDNYLSQKSLFVGMPDELEQLLYCRLKPIRTLNIPVIPCHGDLHSDNIMYDGKLWYVLDWEYSGRYIFIYDLFYWFSLGMLRGRDLFLRNYVDGVYDDYFTECFSIMGLDYKPAWRGAYYCAFLIEDLVAKKGRGAVFGPGYFRRMSQQIACFE